MVLPFLPLSIGNLHLSELMPRNNSIGVSKFNLICLAKVNYESMVSGFPEQTGTRQGNLVFCKRKKSETERE